MAKPDLALVRKIARRLRALLDIRERVLAETGIEELMERMVRRKRLFESTFAAVQMLRDLGTVDHDEAAWLFQSLFYARQDKKPKLDPGTEQLIAESPEQDELIIASIEHNDLRAQEVFYRRRGEDDIAELVRREPDLYDAMVRRGYDSIFEEKDYREGEPEDDRSTDSRAVLARLLAAASDEARDPRAETLLAVMRSLDNATPAAVLRALREAEEIGVVAFAERMHLAEHAIGHELDEEVCGDREYLRLLRRRDALGLKFGLAPEGRLDDDLPFEVRMAELQVAERSRRLMAVVLRRFGERQIANLIMTDLQ